MGMMIQDMVERRQEKERQKEAEKQEKDAWMLRMATKATELEDEGEHETALKYKGYVRQVLAGTSVRHVRVMMMLDGVRE